MKTWWESRWDEPPSPIEREAGRAHNLITVYEANHLMVMVAMRWRDKGPCMYSAGFWDQGVWKGVLSECGYPNFPENLGAFLEDVARLCTRLKDG
jgi:hypothetical protein